MDLLHCTLSHINIFAARDMIATGRLEIGTIDCRRSQGCQHVRCNRKLRKSLTAVRVQADVCGLIQQSTFMGLTYFLVMVADPYRYGRIQLTR